MPGELGEAGSESNRNTGSQDEEEDRNHKIDTDIPRGWI